MSRWFLGAVSAMTLSFGTAAAETVLKVHHFLPATSTVQTQLLEPWCARIQTASQGELRCRIFPAMQLGGGPAQLIDQVRDGVVEVAWTLPGYTPGRFPKAEVFELPFVATTAKATNQALTAFAAKHLQNEFADIKPLLFHAHHPGSFHLRQSAADLSALKGRRLRGPTRLSTQMLADLGATPINLPANQVPEALTRGVIDGALLPFEVTRSLRVLELAPHHLRVPGLYTAVFLFAMNRATYDGLSPALQQVIDDHSGVALAADMGATWDDIERVGQQEAEARGNAVVTVDSAPFAEASAAVTRRWLAEMGQQGIDGQGLLDDARALVRQFGEAAP